MQRVGWGLDAHRFGGEPPLVLGGVVVDDSRGVEATSDGDVVAHAVTDALLGAVVAGDLGDHFPSSDERSADADSLELLARALTIAHDAGWAPVHVDVTVISEDIRIAPHRDEMRRRLADALGIDVDAVSVKATTTDGMVDPSKGIAVTAVVTVSTRS